MVHFQVMPMWSQRPSSTNFVSPCIDAGLNPLVRRESPIMREEVGNQLSTIDLSYLEKSVDIMWIDASRDHTLSSIASSPIDQLVEMQPFSSTALADISDDSDESSGHVATGSRLVCQALSSPFTPNDSAQCTLHLDMTHEDRLFFDGFEPLKQALHETGCKVQFATSNNKVSIVGLVPSVRKICAMLVSCANQSFQIDFGFSHVNCVNLVKPTFVFFKKFCQVMYHVVFYYEPVKNKPNVYRFSFCSNRNNGLNLLLVIKQLMCELERINVGLFESPLTCSVTIPANRRDLTGRANMHIEQIQNQTQTKIEVHRGEDLSFENVKITGNTVFSVIKARSLLVSRFTFELKFKVYIQESRPLVECIAKLSLGLNAVFISIEPSQMSPHVKIISITGQQESVRKLFSLREQILAQMEKSKNLSVENFLLT